VGFVCVCDCVWGVRLALDCGAWMRCSTICHLRFLLSLSSLIDIPPSLPSSLPPSLELCYLKLNWSDDITQSILPDLPGAFAAVDLPRNKDDFTSHSPLPPSLPPSLPLDLCYLKLNWSDDITQPILPDLPRAFAAIDLAKEEGGICLVHCKKGMSRSGAVVVAYLMFQNPKMSLFDALTYARSRRAIIAPNLGFMSQLVEWEREHRGGRGTVDLAKYEENRFGDTAILLCGA